MRRLPVSAFVALVIATVAAFFVVQHLKVTTPLLTGYPIPFPATINPVSGGTCTVKTPHGGQRRVSFRVMKISFYLLHRADDVDVFIEDGSGAIVRQIADGVHMRVRQRRTFRWDGRSAGGARARDGRYFIHVALLHQARSVVIANQNTGQAEPVTVSTTPPALTLTGLSASAVAPLGHLTIRYSGNGGVRPQVLVYRLGAGARPRLVKSYAATTRAGTSLWDGTVAGGRPAPPGRYLIGLSLVDRTCNVVRWPAALSASAAPQAVVTVR